MDINKTAIRLQDGLELSATDERKYKYFTLPNGIKVLLCCDPTTDMAGAALEVSVGHFSDPDTAAGLAHFCEHMLFLGTEKYPDENSYSAYLNEHGGYSNAWTASEQTQYQFEVSKAALEGALDRFAQFFIAPLFTASATDRELQAVDSEHSKNLQSDMWRQYQLDKQTSNPNYPYVKFGTGNSVTLRDDPAKNGVDVRAELLKMHREHYSAGRMTLAVLGAEPLETLQKWATDMFSAVKNNGSKPPSWSGHPYDGVKSIIQYIQPIKDKRQVSVSWAFPPSKGDWRAKSSRYISHLMGHEGPGSLLSALRERGWATGLSAGETDGETGYAVFGCAVDLSPAGLEAWESVLDVIYAYVGLLRAVGPQKWVHDETASLAASSFRFQSKRGVFQTVSNMARALAEPYPPEQVFSGPALYWDWDPKGVAELVGLLRPENSRVALVAKDAVVSTKINLKEKWYGVEYGQEPLGQERLARLAKAADTYEAITKARMAGAGGSPPVGGPTALKGSVSVDAAALAVQQRLGAGQAQPADTGSWDASGVQAALSALYPPLTLPTPNDFIATDFELRHPAARDVATKRALALPHATSGQESGEGVDAALPGSKMLHGVRVRREDAPTLLRLDSLQELWLLQDQVFAVPKTQVQCLLQLPGAYVSPRSTALLELTANLAKENLTEVSYAAQLAGVSYSLSCTVYGLNITVGGFSHKLANLAEVVAAALPKLCTPGGFSDVAFAVQLDKLVRGYANFTKDAPYVHATQNTGVALTVPRWSTREKEAAIKSGGAVTPDELRAFIRNVLASAHLRVFVCGNASPEEAAAICDALSSPLRIGPVTTLPPIASTLTVPRMVALPQAILVPGGEGGQVVALAPELIYTRPASNPAEPNAALELFCQVGPRSVGLAAEQSALVELLGHIVSEPFFDSLRTRQSLGYIVFGGPKQEMGVSGLRFIVQSNRIARAEELLERADEFLTQFGEQLATMPADIFTSQVEATAIKCAEADKNYSEVSNRVWQELVNGTLEFNRATAEVEALYSPTLTQAKVVEWYRTWIAPGGPKRRVFASLVERGAQAEPVAASPPAAGPAVSEDMSPEDAQEAQAAADEAAGAKAAQPGSAMDTLAGGAGQPGADVGHPLPVPKAPVVRVPLAQAAGVLHVLHTHQLSTYVPGTPTDKRLVLQAFREMCGPEVAAEVDRKLGTPAPMAGTDHHFVRLIVDVGPEDHHAVRTTLPLFHDAGSIARMVKMSKLA